MAIRLSFIALYAPSQFVPLLAQCFGQTCAQILGRPPTGVLAHLAALLGEARRFLEKLLSDRLAIERLYVAELADRKIVGIDGRDVVDHCIVVWRKGIFYR